MAEKMLYQDRPAMFRNRPIAFIISILLIPVGIGIMILAVWFLRCYSTCLQISETRTILKTGILSKNTNEVRHMDAKNILVNQSVLQRIFGVGSLAVSSAGQSGIEIMISGIPGPQKAADLIRQAQAAAA